ncbi:amino acid transporter [Luteitalea pratensis]|uniref:amino acid transporter n=1 Tax=Luteitalea pratensis TaxID=1855912 RepID=UPI0012FF6805|nr:amino acid transporter [Luteitalea pratensis]
MTTTNIRTWLLSDLAPESTAAHHAPAHTAPWWQVMCLTGVDYFSTLGYQPGIAFLAAGVLSPLATLVLIALTLAGALPVYRRIAALSPHGQGSISLLEQLLPRWRGKALVLILLGFAATDFVITITLSAADATEHIIHNPFSPNWLDHPIWLTLMLLSALGAVFLKGFKEAIGLAVVIVIGYLALNAVVLAVELWAVLHHPEYLANWRTALFATHGNPVMMVAVALFLFPKLALGLSGFETGVAVMPLVRGEAGETEAAPQGRIRNTGRLLTTAALMMSVLLFASSVATTLNIPASAFAEGGEARGRALAYLAHRDLGHIFGTAYDVLTIAILWFAGASAMAGLLTLIPKYLPRYGMAPDWVRATRPLVLIILLVTCVVTLIFDANVEAQGGAYATGVLVLMTSAALATTIHARKHHGAVWGFGAITLVFAYTTVVNMVERPDGLKIASFFILTIIASSLTSRVLRSTELRIKHVNFDEKAGAWLASLTAPTVRVIANRPDKGVEAEYAAKWREARSSHHIESLNNVLFLEVQPGDASEFVDDVLDVQGVQIGPYHVLRCKSPAVPNAIAALLLHVRDATGRVPHAYFGWTEGNPIAYLLKFMAFGEGDTAPVTREVLRQIEPDPHWRPRIHLG